MQELEVEMKTVDLAFRRSETQVKQLEAAAARQKERDRNSPEVPAESSPTDSDDEDDTRSSSSAAESSSVLAETSTPAKEPHEIPSTLKTALSTLLRRQALLSAHAGRIWHQRSCVQARWARVEEIKAGRGLNYFLWELRTIGQATEKARQKLEDEIVTLVVLRGQTDSL